MDIYSCVFDSLCTQTYAQGTPAQLYDAVCLLLAKHLWKLRLQTKKARANTRKHGGTQQNFLS